MWLAHKQPWIFTRAQWALINLEFAAAYVVWIALVATVIWWILGPNFRRRLASALSLGFVITGLVAMASNAISNPERLLEGEIFLAGATYGVMGAAAGAVTWWISHPRRKNLFVALD